jgi:cytidylate kinase
LSKGPVVAIDGPAGAGKSTVARAVAHRLGCLYLDSGAMYRAVALAALRAGVDLADERALTELAARADITLRMGGGGASRVFLGGEDVTEAVRSAEVEDVVPRVASVAGVRAVMIQAQRRLAEPGGVVMDGRDIGRVVLPGADCKVYLTADLAVRVNRRYLQLRDRGQEAELEEVGRDLARRDQWDRDQMVRAPDAVEIDTTELGVEQTVERILALCPGGARRAGN